MSDPIVLLSGMGLVESARWHDGRVWFADWFAGDIHTVDAARTDTVVAHVPGFPICFDWLPDGRMVTTCGPGQLMTVEPDGTVGEYAAVGAAPNDIAVDFRGNVYVGDLGFEYGSEFRPGTVALVTPGAEPRVVADDLHFPNGMRVTPDGSTLIVAESYANRLTAFDIAADGSLANRRLWADCGEGNAPDGICLAPDGTVWFATVPGTRCVRVAEGGRVLDTVELDRGCFDCALDADESTLYVTAADFSTGDPTGTGRLVAVRLT